jgi:hypothetical protein
MKDHDVLLHTKAVSFLLTIRAAEKAEAQADAEDGKKKKSGTQVPEEWPWEEAKKVFEHPDVTPAAELEVSTSDGRHIIPMGLGPIFLT